MTKTLSDEVKEVNKAGRELFEEICKGLKFPQIFEWLEKKLKQ